MRHGRATIYISIHQPAPPPSTPNVFLSSCPRRNALIGLGHELVGLSKRLVFEKANVLFQSSVFEVGGPHADLHSVSALVLSGSLIPT